MGWSRRAGGGWTRGWKKLRREGREKIRIPPGLTVTATVRTTDRGYGGVD